MGGLGAVELHHNTKDLEIKAILYCQDRTPIPILGMGELWSQILPLHLSHVVNLDLL